MRDKSDPQSRPRRSLRTVLILSLVVNVLLIGFLLGGAARMHRDEARGPGAPDLRALVRAMPDEARSALRERARGDSESGPRESREDRRARAAQSRMQVLALLRSENFDAEALRQLLQQDRAAMERRLEAANNAVSAQIGSLDPGARRAMADRLEESWRERPGR